MPDELNTATDKAAEDERGRRAKWLADLYRPPTAASVPEAPRQRPEDFKPVPSNLDSAISGVRGKMEETVDRFTPSFMKDTLPKGVRLGKKASDALGEKLRTAAQNAATGVRAPDERGKVDMSWDF